MGLLDVHVRHTTPAHTHAEDQRAGRGSRWPVTVRAVVIIETDGSKITRSSHYIDLAGMMAQLGAGAGV